MNTASELCERLLSCAGQHGDAEGSAMHLGDLEDFFRAEFDLLTVEQLGRFWDDPRVDGTVREIPEYEELATAIDARGGLVNDTTAEETRPGSGAADPDPKSRTWDELAGRIAVMTPERRRLPVQPVADRLIFVSLFLRKDEEAPDEFTTVTGHCYGRDDIKDLGAGHRMA